MSVGWAVKQLGEICEILDRKRKPITKRDRVAGPYPYYGATSILDYVEDYIFDEKLVLIGEDGAKWGSGENTAFIVEGKCWVNNHAHVIRPNRDVVLDEWIVYFLNFSNLEKYITGLTVPKLNQGKMRGITLPVPPIEEQRRIVAVLDEALAGVKTAVTNTERNLKNGRELFDSYLQSLNGPKESLGSLVNIATGKLNANAMVEDGAYPFFTCAKQIYAIDHYAFDCEAILLAGNNAVGDFNVKHYKGKFNAYQRTYVITVNEQNQVLYRYLYYQLVNSLKEFKAKSVGANTKFLKLGMIKDMQITLPSIDEQRAVVAHLDALAAQTQQLEAIYQQKRAALTELKQSILQQAFTPQSATHLEGASHFGAAASHLTPAGKTP